MSKSLRPARAVPPGRVIKRELEARGWTQKNLAEIMGRPEQTISEIINGRKSITPETALQLSESFGTSAQLWINLETQYRLHLARQERDESQITRRSRLYSLAPVSEIVSRGWIKAADSVEKLEQEVCSFLGIESPDQQPQLAGAFRQTRTREPEMAAQIAWVRRVKRLACEQSIGEYDQSRALAALPDLLDCAYVPEDVARVPSLLHELGIHFVIVPHLPHTYLDGAAFEVEGHPVVALTLRFDRIDSFWFTLLHELAHNIAGHQGVYLDNLEDLDDNEAETEANRLARDWLIDPGELGMFVKETKPYYSQEKILAFARRQRLHPGIVLGRLHYEGEVPYNNLRKLLVKVKPYLEDWIDSPGRN